MPHSSIAVCLNSKLLPIISHIRVTRLLTFSLPCACNLIKNKVNLNIIRQPKMASVIDSTFLILRTVTLTLYTHLYIRPA